jgi:hypothetical protein
LNLNQLDTIPSDLTRKEGPLKKKMIKEDGTKESRMSSAWKSCYGVLCAGFLIILKEAPNPKAKVG